MRPRPFPSINCVAGLWGNAVEEITYPTEDMNARQRVPWMEKLQGMRKLANNRAGIDRNRGRPSPAREKDGVHSHWEGGSKSSGPYPPSDMVPPNLPVPPVKEVRPLPQVRPRAQMTCCPLKSIPLRTRM